MKISQNDLMNNNFSDEKIHFYEKLGNKYFHAYQKYKRKFPDIKDFKKNVINWLFSNDIEKRMILCSIENKKYTNIIKNAYNEYDKSPCVKFYLKDIEEENELKLFHINNSKLISNNSHDYYFQEKNLIQDLKFYQCESPLNDYFKYSNYFTFFNILKNNTTFIDICDYFSNNKFLENPSKIIDENNKELRFPDWIYLNNILPKTESFKDKKSGINISFYYSLPKLILAFLEQVLSIRYLIYYDTNNLQSIFSSVYLYSLFQKRDDIIMYLNQKEKKFCYVYFKLDELATNLYNDENLKDFIEDKKIKEKAIFCIDNIEIYFNEEDDLKSIILEGNNFFNKFLKENTPKDFLDFFLLINIKQLFTYDDFYFRGIFEKIYETFMNQNIKDLILGEKKEKGNKKRRKNKKKKNDIKEKTVNKEKSNLKMNDGQTNFGDEILKILEDSKVSMNNPNKEDKNEILKTKTQKEIKKEENQIINNIMDDEEKNLIKIFIKNIIYESLFKAIKLYEYQKNIIFKNEKKKNKEFYLYNVIENNKKKKKNKQILETNKNESKEETIIKNESNEKIAKNIEKNHINDFNKLKNTIPLHINSITFNSTKKEENKNDNITINNNNSIKKEKIFLDKNEDEINSSQTFLILHQSIKEYYNILEDALKIQRKIKTELINYFSSLIKTIYPNSEIFVYGSSLYNLDIDTSDLDLSISSEIDISLENLENYLKENNKNNIYTKLNGIFTASVPIIKLEIDYLKIENKEIKKLYEFLQNTEYYKIYYNSENINYMNKINIDISLNSINQKQIDFINHSLKEYPIIIPLIKIIKKILQLKNMNNSYLGGMSSYCLFLLIYSYTKFYYKQNEYKENNEINYGYLLIGLISFYINYIDFNYTIVDPCEDIPFIIDYTLENIPMIIEPISKQNAAKTIYKIFNVIECLRDTYEDIFRIIQTNENNNNLIFELLKEYSLNQEKEF